MMDFDAIKDPLGLEDFEGAMTWADAKLKPEYDVFNPGDLPESVEKAVALFDAAYAGTARADLRRWVSLNALAGTVEGATRLSGEFTTEGVQVFPVALGEWCVEDGDEGESVFVTLDWAHLIGWTVDTVAGHGRDAAHAIAAQLRAAADRIERAVKTP